MNGVVPTDEHYRLIVRLRKSELPPQFAVRRVKLFILGVGDFISSHKEGPGDVDTVRGMFIEVPLFSPASDRDVSRNRFISESHPEAAWVDSDQPHSNGIG